MLGLHKGGKIKGEGSGTSDDVKIAVEHGAYIMPADSAGKMGLGRPSVAINASNGEFNVPPETLEKIGASVLDAVKDATHKPVPDNNGKGLGLFFANGGRVEWDNVKRHHQATLDALGGDNAGEKIGTLVSYPQRITTAAAKDVGSRVVDNASEMAGQAGRAIGNAADSVGGFVSGLVRGLEGGSAKSQINPDKIAANIAKPAAATPLSSAATAKPASSENGAVAQQQAQQSFNGALNQPDADAVRKANYAAGLGVRSGGLSDAQTPSENTTAKQPTVSRDSSGISFAPTGFQAGAQGLVQRYDAQRPFVSASNGVGLSEEQQKTLKAALTPHKGAQNGQLTANQINAARGIIGDRERNELALQQEQIRNNAALQRDQSAQQAQIQRDAINNQAADARQAEANRINQGQFDANMQLRREQLQPEIQAAGFKAEQARMLSDLQNRYLNASGDETRLGLARKIAGLSGNYSENRNSGVAQQVLKPSDYTQKISRPIVDPETGVVMGSQDDVIDLRTGQSIINRVPAAAIQDLRNNPKLRPQFEAKYGRDALAAALG